MTNSIKARFVLISLLVIILAGLFAAEIYAFPRQIDARRGEASVHFATDRSFRLLGDNCLSVNWETNLINAAFLNGDGESGNGEASLCAVNQAILRVDFQDGGTEEYILESVPFFASGAGWLVLIGLGIISYGIFYSFQLMPSPLALLKSIANFLAEIRKDLSHYFQEEDKRHIAMLVAIVLCGFLLRLLYLDAPIRYDEASSLQDYVLVDDIFDSLSRYDRPNNHLLNTLLMYLSVKVFGSIDEWVIRLPNFIAGLLLIPLSYIVGRQQVKKNAALLAAGFVAVAPIMINYSAMARGYMLQIVCFMLMMVLCQYIKQRANAGAWFFFAIFAALGFYAVLTMLYGFVGIALYLLLLMLRDKKVRFWEWFAGMFWAGYLSLLLYIPVLSRFGIKAITANSYTRQLSWDEFFAQLASVFSYLTKTWLGGIANPLLMFLMAIALIFPFVKMEKSHSQLQRLLPLPLMLLSSILIIGIQHPTLFASARMFLFMLPLIGIAIAASIIFLLEKVKIAEIGLLGLTGLLAVLVVFSRAPYLSTEGGYYHDAEAVTAYLAKADEQNFRLAFSPNYDAIINYYFLRYGIPLEQNSRDYAGVESIYFIVRDNYDSRMQAVQRELIGNVSQEFSEPELVASFEFSDLYRIDRR